MNREISVSPEANDDQWGISRRMNEHPVSLLRPNHPDHGKLLADVGRTLSRSGRFGSLDDRERLVPYPFGSPLLLSPEERKDVSCRAREVLNALQDVGERLVRGEALPGLNPFTENITGERFRFDHCYSLLAPVARLDMALTPEGPRVLEINSGCPGGELDGGLLGRTFLDEMQSFEEDGPVPVKEVEVRFRDPREQSMRALLEAYGEFRRRMRPDFPAQPNVALVTGGPQRSVLLPEALGIAEYYRIQGIPAWAGDIKDLRMEGGNLYLGPHPIHLVYRKFASLTLLNRLNDATGHPFLPQVYRSYETHRFCMVNPLGSTLLQDKGMLAVLWNDYPHLRDIIPETHLLDPGLAARQPDVFRRARDGEAFILKRRISFAGKWVILDPEQVRRRLPELLEKEPGRWIVQGRVEEPTGDFSVVTDSGVHSGRYRYNVACFGESFFVRVSLGGAYDPINAGTGGAETCLFEVGDNE